jgi:hypothetical protein
MPNIPSSPASSWTVCNKITHTKESFKSQYMHSPTAQPMWSFHELLAPTPHITFYTQYTSPCQGIERFSSNIFMNAQLAIINTQNNMLFLASYGYSAHCNYSAPSTVDLGQSFGNFFILGLLLGHNRSIPVLGDFQMLTQFSTQFSQWESIDTSKCENWTENRPQVPTRPRNSSNIYIYIVSENQTGSLIELRSGSQSLSLLSHYSYFFSCSCYFSHMVLLFLCDEVI